MKILNSSWTNALADYLSTNNFKKLENFVEKQYSKGITCPSQENVFKAFDLCGFDQTKVVILGQDPYHSPGAADGLCFSVAHGSSQPSLRNIFKEIETDTGKPTSLKDYSLFPWAKQGVLLLNSVLTVEKGLAASHAGKGWEEFTDHVIEKLSEERNGLVFILWGKYAQRKGGIINREKHLVLESSHPSPLSARRGFFGSKPFTKTNDYLVENKHGSIVW